MKDFSSNPEFPQYNGETLSPPELNIAAENILEHEKQGLMGQFLYNGPRVLAVLSPEGSIKLLSFATREPLDVTEERMTEGLKENLEELHNEVGSSKYLVLDGQMLDCEGLKDKYIATDVLVCEDHYFVDMSSLERYMVLDEITGQQEEIEEETGNKIAIYVRKSLWLAETFIFDLQGQINRTSNAKEIKGMILKNPKETGVEKEENQPSEISNNMDFMGINILNFMNI
jgi:hypothetical protein